MDNFARQIKAILYKEIIDIGKNKSLVLINLLFPILALIASHLFNDMELKEMLPMFVIFHSTFTPMLTIANIIGEEKEKYTLKYLILFGVSPISYLFSIGLLVCMVSMATASIFLMLYSEVTIYIIVHFLIANFCEIIASLIIGALIGLIVKNQVSVGVLTAPFGMIISFIPFVGEINSDIAYISKFLYSNANFNVLMNINANITLSEYKYYIINVIFFVFIFCLVFNKKGLEVDE